ncbi:hypothetical protein WMY93_032924 [Mugilogobius chulae]|uniref:Uncharacterized protein n=1 Tax=Mugilogobius chulae TaxID=88201 RepID=A0AAW0MMM7_9GOBI
MDFDETARDNTRAILEALENAGGTWTGSLGTLKKEPGPHDGPRRSGGGAVLLNMCQCGHALPVSGPQQGAAALAHVEETFKDTGVQLGGAQAVACGARVRLGYVDGGYSLQISLVPDKPGPCSSQPLDKTRMSHYTTRALQSVVTILKQRMAGLDASDLSRPTVQKNVLTDLTKVAICHQDQKWLLAQLDSAIQEATIYPRGLRFMVTLVRLGQKDPMTVELYKVVDPLHHVVALSVHVACNIRSSDGHVDLMWSRRLVNSVCGRTGYVYTNQSVTEAANYASNTDHKSVDVGPAVWGLFRDVRGGYGVEGLLNFVQLYCDGPHRHQTPYYKHPVSGILATNGVLHKNTNTAMVQRAQKYLEHFKDLG